MLGSYYHFKNDGTYERMIVAYSLSSRFVSIQEGVWKASKGSIYQNERRAKTSNDGGTTWNAWTYPEDDTMKISFCTEEGCLYFKDLYFKDAKYYKSK